MAPDKDILPKGVGGHRAVHSPYRWRRWGGQCWTKNLEWSLTARKLATQLRSSLASNKSWSCSGFILTISSNPIASHKVYPPQWCVHVWWHGAVHSCFIWLSIPCLSRDDGSWLSTWVDWRAAVRVLVRSLDSRRLCLNWAQTSSDEGRLTRCNVMEYGADWGLSLSQTVMLSKSKQRWDCWEGFQGFDVEGRIGTKKSDLKSEHASGTV